MRFRMLLLAILFISAGRICAIQVSFTVQVPPLQDEEKVLVLGNFNGWTGDQYELIKQPGNHEYKASFDLDLSGGDTLVYKFVVRRPNGELYWEDQANPSNPDHQNRLAVVPGNTEVFSLPLADFSVDAYFRYPVILEVEDMRADFRQMRRLLEDIHPALYDYSPKEVMDTVFDHAYACIRSPMPFREYLCLLSSVVASVGCGHSSMWIPSKYWQVAPEGFFPLRISRGDSLVYVAGGFGEEVNIPPGSTLLEINGMTMKEIMGELESLTSADGMNPAFKRAKVEQHFATKLAMCYGFPTSFHVRYLPYGERLAAEAELKPVSRAMVEAASTGNRELSFRELHGDVALMTIQTFAYYGRVAYFRSFLDSCFSVIREKEIANLILDLRGNSGGDPFCAASLLSYLEQEPVPYFKEHYGQYDTLANPIPRAGNYFQGELLTLIDGNGFSTTGHFCSLLRYHRMGRFVGSELGATYTCTGNATYPALDRTDIMLGTARVMRYTAAVEGMDPGRGIRPDHRVIPGPDDLAGGRDAVLEYALELLRAYSGPGAPPS